ncbi:glycosyltransferase [Kitasatospora viridis]|uniref:Glycosyl transferase family 2 n=1 Tax=Kitasatospora viridis TaxID=281105 RepID=A0A561SFQ3_9ACTN|nr:glycosyltransferase [Kitasatospora viridis]TWF73668.1 glycosyl transferase family 2 [Kitasatospora viridis]
MTTTDPVGTAGTADEVDEVGTVDEVGLAALRELVAAPGDRFRQRPAPGAAQEHRTLTVGMATYDDYDGVYFTVMSLLLYHAEVIDRINILVVDNHPTGPRSWALKQLEQQVPQLRYVPYDRRVGTAARDRIFREAASDWVLCVDSHVQLPPGALAALLDHIDAHPDSDDLLQGPLVSPDGRKVSTHWEPRWRQCMYGVWGTDPRGTDPAAPPFEIGMQGLGVFACRTAAWPGLNPAFAGHGGEEGHLQEKFRRAGGRTLCLPALRWTHRFDVPGATTRTQDWYQRLRNYLIGFDELDQSADEALEHFASLVGGALVRQGLADYRAERNNPFTAFGGITCINLDARPDRWQAMEGRLAALGIRPEQVHRQPAFATAANHHIGCALSHREAIRQARIDGLESVLVLEDDAVFLPGAVWVLRRALAELEGREWSLLYLGGADWGKTFPRPEGCHHLETVTGVTTTHAIAYHRSAFTRLLDELPDTVEEMTTWIQRNTAIDQYLARWTRPDCYRTVPVIAAQANQIELVAPDLRDQFTP